MGRLNIVVAIASVLIALCCIKVNARVDMAHGVFGTWILFYVGALASVVAIVNLIPFATKTPLLQRLGRSSLPIMVWHSILPMLMLNLFALVGIDVNGNPVIKLVSRVLNLSLLVIVVVCIERFVPLLSGKYRIQLKGGTK